MSYIKKGSRNDHLYRVACAIFAKGKGFDAVLKEIEVENRWCQPPLDDIEVMSIVESASKYQGSEFKPRSAHCVRDGLNTKCVNPPENASLCKRCQYAYFRALRAVIKPFSQQEIDTLMGRIKAIDSEMVVDER